MNMCLCGHEVALHAACNLNQDPPRLCRDCPCDLVKIDYDYEPTMELLIGPPPHLRCECGWIFNFHHKTRLIELSLMTDIRDSHLASDDHKEIRASD